MIKLINTLELSIPKNLTSYFGADVLEIKLYKNIGIVEAKLEFKSEVIGEDGCTERVFKESGVLFLIEAKNKVYEIFFDKGGSERLCLKVIEFLNNGNVKTSTQVEWRIDVDSFIGVDRVTEELEIEEESDDLMCIEEFMDYLRDNSQWECSCHINSPCWFCTDGIRESYNEYLKENGVDTNE